MGDEAFQADVGRQAPPQWCGVGPARGGDDEHVVAGQGPGGHQQEAAQVGVVQRALGDVDHGAAARRARATSGGSSKAVRRRRQDRPDEAHRGRKVRAWVLEPRHRLLQVGIDHLGLEVDEVAGEPAGEPASASRRRAKRWMSDSTKCSVAQFMVALRSRRSGPVPGWNATPNGAVSRLFDG